jgi:autoinducer 2-degrading protein
MKTSYFPRASRTGASVLALLALLPAAASGQQEPNPIATQIKAALKDPTKPFTMMVHLQIKEGMQEKFEAAFAKAIKGTRKEKGFLAYDLNRDAKDPTRFVVYERWKNLADLEEHLKTSHITTLLSELKEMLAAAPEAKVFLPAGE